MNAKQRRIHRRKLKLATGKPNIATCHDCDTHAACRWQKRCALSQKVLQQTYLPVAKAGEYLPMLSTGLVASRLP